MSPLALAHILTCAFACAQDSMEAPMAMAAEGSALHVGVIRLHFCRTRRPRAAGSLLSDPAVLAPPGCCDAVGPCCRTPLAPAGPLLSDPAVGLWLSDFGCRTPLSDPTVGLLAVGLSHTAL